MIHLWIRFIHGYSFAIAYGSYGVHHAIEAQSRYLNDTIWPTNTPNTFCDYLLCNANLRVDVATLAKTRCLAATETLVASVIKVAEVYQCLNSLFALTPGWKHTLLAAAVTFADSVWLRFTTMALDVPQGVDCHLREMAGP